MKITKFHITAVLALFAAMIVASEGKTMIARGGVVDKLMLAKRSLLLRWLIYHPVCANKEGGLFLYGAATPPVQEGKFAGPNTSLSDTLGIGVRSGSPSSPVHEELQ